MTGLLRALQHDPDEATRGQRWLGALLLLALLVACAFSGTGR